METLTEGRVLEQALSVLATAGIPDAIWRDHDDLCDCTFQRVCQWTNPYFGTHEERLCCIWAKLHEMFPGCSRDIPAYFDINEQAWKTKLEDWNAEFDMPAAVWHRHLAAKRGISVSEARALNLPAPKGKPFPEKVSIYLPVGGDEYAEFVLG